MGRLFYGLGGVGRRPGLNLALLACFAYAAGNAAWWVDKPAPGALRDIRAGRKTDRGLLLTASSHTALQDGPAQVFGRGTGEERVGSANMLPEVGVAAASFSQVPALVGGAHSRAHRSVGGRWIVYFDAIDSVALFQQ